MKVTEEPKVIEYEGRQMVVITREHYNGMIEAIEDAQDDLAAYIAREEANDHGFIPAEVSQAIRSGKNPVAAWRTVRGLTQAQLAAAANLKQPAIGRLERGNWPAAHDSTLKKVADALNAPFWTLRPHDADESEHGTIIRAIKFVRGILDTFRQSKQNPELLDVAHGSIERLSEMPDEMLWQTISSQQKVSEAIANIVTTHRDSVFGESVHMTGIVGNRFIYDPKIPMGMHHFQAGNLIVVDPEITDRMVLDIAVSNEPIIVGTGKGSVGEFLTRSAMTGQFLTTNKLEKTKRGRVISKTATKKGRAENISS